MAFLSDADIKTALAGTMHLAEASLEDWWDAIIAGANVTAQKEIVGEFLSRDLTAAQAEDWDRCEEFQRDMALFWAFTRSGVGALDGEFNRDNLKALDRRKDLKAAEILIGGETVDITEAGGKLVIGALDTDGDTITPDWEW